MTLTTNPSSTDVPVAAAVPAHTLKTAVVPVDALQPYPGNARRSDDEAIKASLVRNGLYRHIVVNS